ncbi:phosphopantetheine-binding protein [Xenorhabdus bovienii]|uniref:Putative Acyl carrier protein n=1 Tax=Xenorhabdus bovienii str. feltiae Moldova TaxID=1398200 RepID=A0A077NTV4_XENBV|nr:phosphopantetheine-binding protein [Xenorhabdus bovienii]CDH01954.1 putative Acyl carrier protein [Xenorhabdus bovienii str. feltiae Moldova]
MKGIIFDRIKSLLTDKYYVSVDEITKNVIYDDLDLDSLTLLEISVVLEKEFNLSIPDGLIFSDMSIEASINKILNNNVNET